MTNNGTSTTTSKHLRFKPRGMLRLDDDQYDRLRRVAFEEHVDMTQIIREGIERRLNEIERNRRRRQAAQATG
jgi:predicted DNA-binding protein